MTIHSGKAYSAWIKAGAAAAANAPALCHEGPAGKGISA